MWSGETLLYLVQTRLCTVDGKQHNTCSCLILALDNQLVGSPDLWGVDLLSYIKDIFIFWDFLPHVLSIVIPSPFYSPNEHLQNKGGSQGTVLYVLRGMREWWRVSGVSKENQADSRGFPSFPWVKRQAVMAHCGGPECALKQKGNGAEISLCLHFAPKCPYVLSSYVSASQNSTVPRTA